MKETDQQLTIKKIFIFWYPLAATWLMMALENPFLTAIIARLGDPKFNLAAFGVAFRFALIAEAPIIMLMSASTALITNRDAYLKLRKFTIILNSAITVFLLIGIIPPIFYYIAEDLIELPSEIAKLTHLSLILLLPWPAAIGFRRFYQGLLIRFNYTRRVAYGTVVRISSMAITALILFLMKVNGAYVGAIALSTGVTFEAITTRFMAHQSIKKILKQKEFSHGEKPLSFSFICKFYYPLALMSFLSLGVHPLVTFFVGKSKSAIESLAVLPVIDSLIFIFRSMGLSFLEVVITFMGKQKQNYFLLRKFAIILGFAVVSILSLIAFTPLAKFWFQQVAGLTVDLAGFAYLPIQIVAILPGLSVLISFQRGLLVSIKKTGPISWATIIEVSMIIAVLFITINYFNFIGAIAVALAFTIGRLIANIYLFYNQLKLKLA